MQATEQSTELKSIGQADRATYIGGSDAAAILGISPWKTALDVFLDKTQGKEQGDPSKAKIFARGKRMEPYVIDLLAEDEGITIVNRGQRYQDQEYDFLAAEIDAEFIAPDGSVQNIEIKTVSPFKAKEWGEQATDAIPLHYAAQAMHGLMVTGRRLCVFGVLIGADDFRVYRIERDDETIAAMRDKEVEFWHAMQRGEMPEATSAADIARLFDKDAGTAVEADAPALEAYNRLREAQATIKEAEKQEAVWKEALQVYMADAARLTCEGKDLATWKSQSARRFDQKAFAAANPELAEQFKTESTSRVFRLK